jgi:hypothetical protein
MCRLHLHGSSRYLFRLLIDFAPQNDQFVVGGLASIAAAAGAKRKMGCCLRGWWLS